jgi:hypothetical protein
MPSSRAAAAAAAAFDSNGPESHSTAHFKLARPGTSFSSKDNAKLLECVCAPLGIMENCNKNAGTSTGPVSAQLLPPIIRVLRFQIAFCDECAGTSSQAAAVAGVMESNLANKVMMMVMMMMMMIMIMMI